MGPVSDRTLSDLGVSKKQSARFQQLADVPEEDFEAALAAPKKPRGAGLFPLSQAVC